MTPVGLDHSDDTSQSGVACGTGTASVVSTKDTGADVGARTGGGVGGEIDDRTGALRAKGRGIVDAVGGTTGLTDRYLPGAAISGARQGKGVVLICEHASPVIPAALADLGLPAAHRFSHAVYDIGAMDLARVMRDAMAAPLIAGATSRLVYDCNRPPDAPSAMPERSEVIDVPGNRALSEADRWARARAIYEPFGAAVADVIGAQRIVPAIVTIHTFSPLWHGEPRRAEIGLLHDDDPRLALAMAACAPLFTGLRTELNVPYAAADGVTHTLARFATRAGLPSVMIEVRNDLVDTPAKAACIGVQLAQMVSEGLLMIGHPAPESAPESKPEAAPEPLPLKAREPAPEPADAVSAGQGASAGPASPEAGA